MPGRSSARGREASLHGILNPGCAGHSLAPEPAALFQQVGEGRRHPCRARMRAGGADCGALCCPLSWPVAGRRWSALAGSAHAWEASADLSIFRAAVADHMWLAAGPLAPLRSGEPPPRQLWLPPEPMRCLFRMWCRYPSWLSSPHSPTCCYDIIQYTISCPVL
jgi:hypothetical protein